MQHLKEYPLNSIKIFLYTKITKDSLINTYHHLQCIILLYSALLYILRVQLHSHQYLIQLIEANQVIEVQVSDEDSIKQTPLLQKLISQKMICDFFHVYSVQMFCFKYCLNQILQQTSRSIHTICYLGHGKSSYWTIRLIKGCVTLDENIALLRQKIKSGVNNGLVFDTFLHCKKSEVFSELQDFFPLTVLEDRKLVVCTQIGYY